MISINKIYLCDELSTDAYPALLKIWEASVRATHLFLKEDDILFFKKTIIEENIFGQTHITVARNEQKEIIGFMGVSGTELDMIFLLPEWIGKGVGKMLMQNAIEKQKIDKVEVNEQNREAIGFYEHFGFKPVARTETDGIGKPFPLLYMEL